MDPILNWLGLPVAASAHAGEVDRIMALVHWLMLVLFVGWSVFFVYVLLRFRSGAHPKADYRGVRGGWSNWVEGGVLVAEIVLLAFIFLSGGGGLGGSTRFISVSLRCVSRTRCCHRSRTPRRTVLQRRHCARP